MGIILVWISQRPNLLSQWQKLISIQLTSQRLYLHCWKAFLMLRCFTYKSKYDQIFPMCICEPYQRYYIIRLLRENSEFHSGDFVSKIEIPYTPFAMSNQIYFKCGYDLQLLYFCYSFINTMYHASRFTQPVSDKPYYSHALKVRNLTCTYLKDNLYKATMWNFSKIHLIL